jgi:hypothetical protein
MVGQLSHKETTAIDSFTQCHFIEIGNNDTTEQKKKLYIYKKVYLIPKPIIKK